MAKRRILLRIALVLLIYLFTEGVCYIGLFIGAWARPSLRYSPVVSVLSDRQKTILNKFIRNPRGQKLAQDAELGWVPIAETNSAGMRDDQEYGREALPNIIRLSSFGDSFTYGSGVHLNETWQKQLSTLHPSLEVFNYGCGAYGLDQAYLRYLREGSTYNPHIVFIGFMSENIARNVNVYRPFYSDLYYEHILTKPRFVVKNGALQILKNPILRTEDLKRFIENDKGLSHPTW